MKSPVIVVLVIASALRFFYLGRESLWFDEAFSLAVATNLSPIQIAKNAGQSVHPPLYYLLLHYWVQLVGVSEYAARFLSAGWSLLAVAAIYRVGRTFFDGRVALFGMLLMAFMPFQIQYAHEARMYSLLLFLTTVSLFAFFKALRSGATRWWALYFFSTSLGLYTHYLIGFVLLAYHCFWLIYISRYRRYWWQLVVVDVLTVVAFLPQLTVFFYNQANVVFEGNYWLASPHIVYLFLSNYFLIFGSYPLETVPTYVGIFAVLSLLAIGIYQIINKKFDRFGQQEQVLILVGSFFPMITIFLISQYKPIYLNRTLIICTPFLVLFLALILVNIRIKSPVPLLFGVLVTLISITLSNIFIYSLSTKMALREIAIQTFRAKQKNDLLLHTSQWTALPFMFYKAPADNAVLAADPNPILPPHRWTMLNGRSLTLEEVAREERVWLITDVEHTDPDLLASIKTMRKTRPILQEKKYGSLTIQLYGETTLTRNKDLNLNKHLPSREAHD